MIAIIAISIAIKNINLFVCFGNCMLISHYLLKYNRDQCIKISLLFV